MTEQLDTSLDWTTFQLGNFGFGSKSYTVPAGLTSYSTRVDATSTVGVYVDVVAPFQRRDRSALTWTFTSIDPVTLDEPVGNVLEGFLPPDAVAPQGEGWVTYFVQPKATDGTGTKANAAATVIFDAGLSDQSSLGTAPILNTIDAGAPTSSVTILPTFSPATFTVNWSGHDDSNGSGIATYNVYMADGNSSFTLWQSQTTQTTATVTGHNRHICISFLQARRHRQRRQCPTNAHGGSSIDSSGRHRPNQ